MFLNLYVTSMLKFAVGPEGHILENDLQNDEWPYLPSI